ncbi:protein enabled homolog [Penaeus chinensis]|nr:protein enabled homolog [Penaeus chinensis]XP_047498561.1 protein enabled homolog [Penaeus chinensis]
MNREQERQKRSERFQRRRNLQFNSQPTSRDPSPSQVSSELQLAVVTGGSNPDVREAVRVMEAEVDMFSQIMERVNTLIAEVQGCKEQNDRLENRLQRQEEMLREQRQLEDRAERDDQHQTLAAQRGEEIQQLRHQLQQQRVELEEARHFQSAQHTAPTDTTQQADERNEEIHQLRRRLQELENELAGSRPSRVSLRTAQVVDTISSSPVPPQPLPRSRPQTSEPVDRPLPPQPQLLQNTQPYLPHQPLPERNSFPSHPRDLSTRCWNCSPANGL